MKNTLISKSRRAHFLGAVLAAVAVQYSGAALAANTLSRTLTVEADTLVRTDLDVRRNDNYGKQQILVIGTGRGGDGQPYGAADAMRALVRFDLAGLPTEPLISANLVLSVYQFGSGSPTSVFTIGAHRIVPSGLRTPWEEGNGFEGWPVGAPAGSVDVDAAFGVAWSGLGDNPDPSAANNKTQPDFDAVAEATTLVDRATTLSGDLIQWNVSSIVKKWIRAEVPNLGLMLRDSTSAGDFRELYFDAKDGAALTVPDPKWHAAPRLLLVFQAEPDLKSDCKNDGWRRYSLFQFKNQGECVSYVATHGRNVKDEKD